MAWKASEVTKDTIGGFLLNRGSWPTKDSYGMGPEKMIVPPRDISYSGHTFPLQTKLTSPDLSDVPGLTEQQLR